MTDLPDVNVWVALSYTNHLHRPQAKAYWGGARANKIAFCGVTLTGMLRILTQAAPMNGNPFSPAVAAQKAGDWLQMPEVSFISDSTGVSARLSAWASEPFFTPKLWTDGWIAAIAMEHGCRVVSFDADFAKFPGLNFLQLTP